jgi:8-oxo-dGTP diphosphatase
VKHVVAAIIVEKGRIFLTQRRPGKSFPLTWECPGGCVEDGETQEAALRRELDEEIGIMDADIADLEAAHVDVEMTGDGLPVGAGPIAITVYFFHVWLRPASAPRPREGQGSGWFTLGETSALRLTPGNAMALHGPGTGRHAFVARLSYGCGCLRTSPEDCRGCRLLYVYVREAGRRCKCPSHEAEEPGAS